MNAASKEVKTAHTRYAVGQKLVLVRKPSRSGEIYRTSDVIVKTVGRKWITLTNDSRFDPETGEVDHGVYSSDERVFDSMEAFKAHVDLKHAWSDFRNFVDRRILPPTSNIEAIKKAAHLLGFSFEARANSAPEKEG